MGEEGVSLEDSDEGWPTPGATTKIGVRSSVTLVSLYKVVQRSRGSRTFAVLVPAVGCRLLSAVRQLYLFLINEALIAAAPKLELVSATAPTMR